MPIELYQEIEISTTVCTTSCRLYYRPQFGSTSRVRYLKISLISIKNNFPGLSWWYSGWESACQHRGYSFDPWPGRIPHFLGQLSSCATTTEPMCLEPGLVTREATAMRSPCTTLSNTRSLQLVKALNSNGDPAQPKSKYTENLKKITFHVTIKTHLPLKSRK